MIKSKAIYYLVSIGLIVFSLEGNSLLHYLSLLAGLVVPIVVFFKK